MAARPYIPDRHGSRSGVVRRRAALGVWGGACVAMPLCRCVVADAAGRVSWACAPGRRSAVMQRRCGAALQCSGRHPRPQGVGSDDRREFVPMGCRHVRTAKRCPASWRSAVRAAKVGLSATVRPEVSASQADVSAYRCIVVSWRLSARIACVPLPGVVRWRIGLWARGCERRWRGDSERGKARSD